MNFLRKVILTGLGSGYLRGGGTVASLIPCAIFLGLGHAAGAGSPNRAGAALMVNLVMLGLAAGACLACVALGKFAEQAFGRKDPSQCTIDEVAGQSLALLLVPLAAGAIWAAALISFVAFRLFDIIKPFPCRRLEKLPLGWGVLLDDVVAAIYANIATQVAMRILLWKGVFA
jgi:phosphatidylglycerophosphatase A